VAPEDAAEFYRE